jgi:hypothetical protein
METIDVCMTSWPNHPKRLDYFAETIEACRRLLTATGYELRYYCSAESERDPKAVWCGDALIGLCREYDVELEWRGPNANLGANMNAAMRMGAGRFVYLQQDDWRLEKPLDLAKGAALLVKHDTLDIVRYSWPQAPHMAPSFRGTVDGWPKIDVTGNWPYGDDPHLRRRDFMARWGWYFDKGPHGSASGTLMGNLVKGKADIVVADKCYYHHFGYVSANVIDPRGGNDRRYT